MLAIEIRNNRVALTEGSTTRGRVTVKKASSFEFDSEWSSVKGALAINEMADRLVLELQENGFGSKRDVAVCFNQSYTVYRELKVPAVETKKLAIVVRSEMISSLNLEPDCIVDYVIIDSEEDETGSYYHVLAVALQKDFFESYLEVFKRAKLKVKTVDFGANALMKVIEMSHYLQMNQLTLVLNISRNHLRLFIFDGLNYSFTRSIQISDEADTTTEVVGNLNRMIQYVYARYDQAQDTKVLLTGEEEFFEDVKENIESTLNLQAEAFEFPSQITNNTGQSLLSYINAVGAMIKRR